MRKEILFIFFYLGYTCYGQTSEANNIRESKKKNITEKITSSNDSIKRNDLVNNITKSKENLNRFKDSLFVAIVLGNGKILKEPSLFSDVILSITVDTKATLFDYSNGYFGVCIDSSCGYVNGTWIKTTPELLSFMSSNVFDKERTLKEKIYKNKIESENIKKYGITTYDKLKKGYYWIGMTADMALIALGEPKDINRTVGSWGIHEQWVYGKKYFYFENGKMTSFQD